MTEGGKNISITTVSWVKAMVVFALAYALYIVRPTLLIILTSIVIASAVEPAAVWARKRGLPRLPAVLSVYILSALTFVVLFYFLFLPLVGETANFLRTLPTYSDTVATEAVTGEFITGQSILNGIQDSFSTSELASYLNSLLNSLSQGLLSSVAEIFGGALSFVLIVVLSFYLAVQDDGVGKFIRVIAPLEHEEYMIGLWRRSQRKIGLWMQGQLLLAVIVMVLSYLGLLLIGLPHALLLAVLAGIFEIIPLFGPILAAIPAMFVAFAAGGPTMMLIVAGLFLIIQQFENHLIYPLVVKKVVGVPPMVSIIALIVGGQLAGFLGVLIAVPVAAVGMELLSDLEQRKIAKIAKNESQS